MPAAAVQRLQQEFQGTTSELGTIAAARRCAELVESEAALEANGLDRADLDVMLATERTRMPGRRRPRFSAWRRGLLAGWTPASSAGGAGGLAG